MQVKSVDKVRFFGSIVFSVIVLLFGIVFLTVAIIAGTQSVPEDYIKTDATITKIEEELLPYSTGDDIDNYEHHVFVEYTYDGKAYEDYPYGNYSSSMKVGDTVIIYVNPSDPGEFISDPAGVGIFIAIGAVIVVGGAVGVVYNVIKKKKKKENA